MLIRSVRTSTPFGYGLRVCKKIHRKVAKKTLIYYIFVIPANAGIQETQRTGPRLSPRRKSPWGTPGRRILQCFPKKRQEPSWRLCGWCLFLIHSRRNYFTDSAVTRRVSMSNISGADSPLMSLMAKAMPWKPCSAACWSTVSIRRPALTSATASSRAS